MRIYYCIDNFLGTKPNYQRYNDITGALIRCEKEIIRRFEFAPIFFKEVLDSYDEEIAKYEDEKIISNGDVD